MLKAFIVFLMLAVVVSLFSGWQSIVGFGVLSVLTAAAVFVLPRLEQRVWDGS